MGRFDGCRDIARCNPRLWGTALARVASWSLDSLACRARCGRGDGCRFSVLTGGKYSLCEGPRGEKPRGNLGKTWFSVGSVCEECRDPLVEIADLQRWRRDVRMRQRWWVLQKRLSITITSVMVANVVFSNSNDHTSRRKGWDPADEGGGRSGDRFPFDRLNLGRWDVLTG